MEPQNIRDGEWSDLEHGETEFRRKKLSTTENIDLGCSVYELLPGKKSWPYHYHTANDEAIYVLAGSGTLRGLDGTVPITVGDYVGFPADETGGHRVSNTGDEPLRYLMVSTMIEPDVTVYPDSEKFGVFVSSPPGGTAERSLHGFYPLDADVDYWDNE